MQKTIATTFSVAASLILIAGTLAPAVYGAAAVSDSCTVRADITSDEVSKLAPGDPHFTGSANDQTIVIPSGVVLEAVGGTVSGADQTPNWGLLCTYGVIKQISNILFLIVGILSVAVIVYAAFLFIFEGASPGKEARARTVLLAAIIGLVVAIAAKIIPAIALGLLGVGH